MIKEIKYPYKELSVLERQRIDLYRAHNLVDYKDVHVYYTTEKDLGVGYSIIITLSAAKKDKYGIYNYGPTAEEITDIDNLLENF